MDTVEKIKWIYVAFLAVLTLITQPFILKKAGYPLWAGAVPVYNTICMCYSTFGNARLVLLLLIPGVNFAFYFVMLYEFVQLYGFDTVVGQQFRHKGKFAIYMGLFPWLLGPVLAFGPSTYLGQWRGPDPFKRKCSNNNRKCEMV